jgi:hypothetical protein
MKEFNPGLIRCIFYMCNMSVRGQSLYRFIDP